MDKTLRLVALGVVALAIAIMSLKISDARITGVNPTGASADAFCVGKSGSEACVDSSGNLIPTTTAVSSLGSASLQWLSAQVSGTVAAKAVVPTDTTSSRLHLPVVSTQTMITVTTTAGDQFLTQSTAKDLSWVCISTGGVNSLVFSSNTAVACRQGP